jgi:hypothetical protein
MQLYREFIFVIILGLSKCMVQESPNIRGMQQSQRVATESRRYRKAQLKAMSDTVEFFKLLGGVDMMVEFKIKPGKKIAPLVSLAVIRT